MDRIEFRKGARCGGRVLVVALAAALAASLSPATALAATFEAGNKAPQQVSTQAATKTVYVLAKKVGVNSEYENGSTWYTYNKNGLISKKTYYENDCGTVVNRLYYDKRNYVTLNKTVKHEYSWYERTKYVRNSKGLPTKMARKALFSESSTPVMSTFVIKGGKIRSEKTKSGSVSTYKYNKVGRISSVTHKFPNGTKYTTRYAYDKRGNLRTSSSWLKYDANGNPSVMASAYGSTFKYVYKTVKVPKSMVSRVKEQQWAILNDNLNFAI